MRGQSSLGRHTLRDVVEGFADGTTYMSPEAVLRAGNGHEREKGQKDQAHETVQNAEYFSHLQWSKAPDSARYWWGCD